MTDGRPYDPNLLNTLVEEARAPRSAAQIEADMKPEPYVFSQPWFESHPSGFDRASIAWDGLRLAMSASGRRIRAEDRAKRIQNQFDVVHEAGNRMLITDAEKKVGWPGVHRYGDKSPVQRAEESGKVANRLMDYKKSSYPSPAPGVPRGDENLMRSVEGPAIRHVRKMERLYNKATNKRLNARSISKNQGQLLNARAHFKHRRDEEKTLRALSDEGQALEEGASKQADRYFRVMKSETAIKGKVNRWRLERARTHDSRRARRMTVMRHPASTVSTSISHRLLGSTPRPRHAAPPRPPRIRI